MSSERMYRSIRILSVVGARPNFMKVAPLVREIEKHNQKVISRNIRRLPSIEHILVHTGQHYDWAMSDAFFSDLHLPEPQVFLGVGSGTHAKQTALIMEKFESVLIEKKPDFVIVVGDVNSTLACALVASKISYDGPRPLIAHVEAGLRSFDRTMPEEINRIVTDRLSDLLFVTEESGIENLQNEGIPAEKIYFVGNTMIDTLLSHVEKADQSRILTNLGLVNKLPEIDQAQQVKSYSLLTLHRPSNVDKDKDFMEILKALHYFDGTLTMVFPVHPRTQKQIMEKHLDNYFHFLRNGDNVREGKINVLAPLGYIDFLCLMKNASLVLTDSGGIQEETTCLGIPCVTIRANTERPVTVSEGTNTLAGLRREEITNVVKTQLTKAKVNKKIPKYWDGKAAERIVDILVKQVCP